MLVTQLCPTLCNPTDCSPPGFSVHEIFQARILEWAAISFSRDRTWVSCTADRFFTDWVSWVNHSPIFPHLYSSPYMPVLKPGAYLAPGMEAFLWPCTSYSCLHFGSIEPVCIFSEAKGLLLWTETPLKFLAPVGLFALRWTKLSLPCSMFNIIILPESQFFMNKCLLFIHSSIPHSTNYH